MQNSWWLSLATAFVISGTFLLAEDSPPSLGPAVKVEAAKAAEDRTPASEPMLGLRNESSLGFTLNGGNSDLQSYLIHQKTRYNWLNDTVSLNGHYLLGRAASAETARNWDIAGRYERYVSRSLGAFIGNSWEGNTFAGVRLRTNIDLGATYFLLGDKDSGPYLANETGYRFQYEERTFSESPRLFRSHLGRVYFEGRLPITPGVSLQTWVELLPNFTRPQNYFINFEPSLAVMLSNQISIKLAFHGNFRGQPPAGKKNFDYLYTSSLIAAY